MKKDSEICVLAVKAVPRYVGEMVKLAGEIRRGKRGETIHDMRVASRRLRAALCTFANCFVKKDAARWSKQIRGVTKAMGKARDLDVQILTVHRFLKTQKSSAVRAVMKHLLLRLEQKRKKAQKKLVAAAREFVSSDVYDELRRVGAGPDDTGGKSTYSNQMYSVASKTINERLTAFLAYADNVHDSSKTDLLHAMRIEAKKLRYTMELNAEMYQGGLEKYITAARQLQTALGDMHDYVVWIEFLPQFVKKEQRSIKYRGTAAELAGIERAMERFGIYCVRQRDSNYAKFVRLWERFKRKRLWEELNKVITGSDKGKAWS
jgi:CHAD domain-containing protein